MNPLSTPVFNDHLQVALVGDQRVMFDPRTGQYDQQELIGTEWHFVRQTTYSEARKLHAAQHQAAA